MICNLTPHTLAKEDKMMNCSHKQHTLEKEVMMIFNLKQLISAKVMATKIFPMTCNQVEPISAKVVETICNRMLHTLLKAVVMICNLKQLTYKVVYKGKTMDLTVTKWSKVWMMENQISSYPQRAEQVSMTKLMQFLETRLYSIKHENLIKLLN